MTSPRQKKQEQGLAQAREEILPSISINRRRLLRCTLIFCLVAEVLFVFLDAVISYGHWIDYGMFQRLFNIAREDSLPAWFGTTQTWMVGLTLGLLYLVTRRDGRPRFVRFGWLLLTVFFLYMAADDGSRFHERIGSAFDKKHDTAITSVQEDSWQAKSLKAYPSYTWQIVFMPIFIGFGIFMVIFLWREMRGRKERILMLAAMALLSLCVVLDFYEGLNEQHPGNIQTQIGARIEMQNRAGAPLPRSPYDTVRHFSKSVEEFTEMLATTLLWIAFLSHLMKSSGGINIRFTEIPSQE